MIASPIVKSGILFTDVLFSFKVLKIKNKLPYGKFKIHKKRISISIKLVSK